MYLPWAILLTLALFTFVFISGDVIFLNPHIDYTLTEDSYLSLIIRGVQTNQTKWVSPDDMFGPASVGVGGERVSVEEWVTVE